MCVWAIATGYIAWEMSHCKHIDLVSIIKEQLWAFISRSVCHNNNEEMELVKHR